MKTLTGIVCAHVGVNMSAQLSTRTSLGALGGAAQIEGATGGAARPFHPAQPERTAGMLRAALRRSLRRTDNRRLFDDSFADSAPNPIDSVVDDVFGYRMPGTEMYRRPVVRLTPLTITAPVMSAPALSGWKRSESGLMLAMTEHLTLMVGAAFTLDLEQIGAFIYEGCVEGWHLDERLRDYAETNGLEYDRRSGVYRLPFAERARRVGMVLRALARLDEGAPHGTTDLTPVFVCLAVLSERTNPFTTLVNVGAAPTINTDALDEALSAYDPAFLSGIYVGLRQGIMRGAGEVFAARGIEVTHPRQALDEMAQAFLKYPEWLG